MQGSLTVQVIHEFYAFRKCTHCATVYILDHRKKTSMLIPNTADVLCTMFNWNCVLKRFDHLVAIERSGRASDGNYYNMRGVNIKHLVDPIDDLFTSASTIAGITTTGNKARAPMLQTTVINLH